MKSVLAGVILLLFLNPGAPVAADPLAQGLQLLGQHRYEEAFQTLRAYLPAAEPRHQAKAQLAYGMAGLANARCYAALYDVARVLQLDYLTRLVETQQSSKSASRLAHLYLGKALLASGNLKAAIPRLQRFLRGDGLASALQNEALVSIGTASYLSGQKARARKIWSAVPEDSPEILAALAAAYSRVNLTGEQPQIMADRALAQLKTSGQSLSTRLITSILAVDVLHGEFEKGLSLIDRANLGEFAHEERLAEDKIIRFYDPLLLSHLSRLYALGAVAYLTKAKAAPDRGVQSVAFYHLGEAYQLLGQPDAAASASEAFLSMTKNSPELAQFRQRVQARQVFASSGAGDQLGACQAFRPLLGAQPQPALLSEMLQLAGQFEIACPRIIEPAAFLLQRTAGKAAGDLNYSLGRYYLGQKAYDQALAYLEAGRDKSRKNRIEANPPMLLIGLAQAYYHTRQFSEALEIYFTMGRQFPALRQIQMALQGVYAMEQQSAGDAKIF